MSYYMHVTPAERIDFPRPAFGPRHLRALAANRVCCPRRQ
jgi:hypothetical protein